MSSTASSPATTFPSGTWQVDPVHSTVGFSVRHMVVSTFRGRFEEYDARLVATGDDPQLTGTVAVRSIVVKDDDLAAHLRSAEFFDADRFPELRFASTSMRRAGDRVEVLGDLTIKGITRPVRADGAMTDAREDPYGATRMGLELEAVVDRREFGLTWNMALPKGGFALGHDVTLHVDLELTRA